MSERVLLIDVDSTIPNLALMKISAYWKAKGAVVGFNVEDPTRVYASCIFDWNAHKVDGLRTFYPDADINIGGSGVSLSLSLTEEVEKCFPDYSLYPEWESDLGMTTRGCIRNCYFCIVPKKEGKFRRYMHPSEFHLDGHKSAVLMDNNILADPDWFFEVTNWYIEHNIKIDFNQGLDIRLMTEEIAQQLKRCKRLKLWRFAFDSMAYRDEVERGIDIMKEAGLNLRRYASFYVYLHDDSQFDDALERCRILRSHDCLPYLMINRHAKRTQRMTDLKRWTRPQIFFSSGFEDYIPNYRRCKE